MGSNHQHQTPERDACTCPRCGGTGVVAPGSPRPLKFYVDCHGAAFLDNVVETFAATGSLDATRAAVRIGEHSNAVHEFFRRVLGIPSGHGGRRALGTGEATRNPAADLARRVWKRERPRVLALYGVTE